MPSGPAHLHKRYVDDDVAWQYLRRRGFTRRRGVIAPPYRGHRLSKGESDAIDYLWMEWDWSYAPSEAPESMPEVSMLLSWGRWLRSLSSGPLRVWEACLARLRYRYWQWRDRTELMYPDDWSDGI